MGWKASMILINSEEEFDKNDFFESLGYYNLEKTDQQYFDSVINPDEDKIYLGQYNGNTIICMQGIPLESMDESMSKAETILSNKFPNSDIVTFVLHSTVNLWGYSIARNGEKIRVRFGASDEGTIVEYGEILDSEKELFSKSRLNKYGERIFIFDDMPEDEFLDDQVGENFVFDVSKAYLGEKLDFCDELFETEFEGYSFSKQKSKNIKENKKTITPWWKFW